MCSSDFVGGQLKASRKQAVKQHKPKSVQNRVVIGISGKHLHSSARAP